MKLKIRRSAERGKADHGWLQSRHTFSFADYHDSAHAGFRSLRVINQDRVAPEGGFPTHPHRDMEIFSYVLEGTLEHQDSLGHGKRLQPGQIQLMSAGQGIRHSEFNPSPTESLHFLQIWIQPETRGIPPSYTEWHPSLEQENQAKVLVISREGREGSAVIHQDADVFRLRLAEGQVVTHDVRVGRGIWFQLIRGTVTTGETSLTEGDAFSVEEPGHLTLLGNTSAEGLLFDLG
jgi:quercetin 2,3-dioxygenase